MNQILEDMLRACVISSKSSWEKWLPLAEFSYNNNYQASIKMSPFELVAFYAKCCQASSTYKALHNPWSHFIFGL